MLETNGLHFLAKLFNKWMFWMAEMSETVIFHEVDFSRDVVILTRRMLIDRQSKFRADLLRLKDVLNRPK